MTVTDVLLQIVMAFFGTIGQRFNKSGNTAVIYFSDHPAYFFDG